MTIEHFNRLPQEQQNALYEVYHASTTTEGKSFNEWIVSQPHPSLPFPADLFTAFKQDSFPVNPQPFANAIAAGCKEFGTDWIRSDEARALLFVLMAQSHGQLARINLFEEWARLNKLF